MKEREHSPSGKQGSESKRTLCKVRHRSAEELWVQIRSIWSQAHVFSPPAPHITLPSWIQQTCLLPGKGRGGKAPAFRECLLTRGQVFVPALSAGGGLGGTPLGGWEPLSVTQTEVVLWLTPGNQRSMGNGMLWHGCYAEVNIRSWPPKTKDPGTTTGCHVLFCNPLLYSSCQSPNAIKMTHFFFSPK